MYWEHNATYMIYLLKEEVELCSQYFQFCHFPLLQVGGCERPWCTGSTFHSGSWCSKSPSDVHGGLGVHTHSVHGVVQSQPSQMCMVCLCAL